MIRSCSILILMASLLPAQEQVAGLADARQALGALAKKQAEATHMSAKYRQERSTVLLRTPLVSFGTLTLRAKPACIIFRNISANGAIIRLTKKLYEVHRPAQKTLERTILPSSTLAEALFQSFQPNPRSLEKNFRITKVKSDDKVVRIELEPRDKYSRRLLTSFSITVATKTSSLQRIGYTDPQGDAVVLILENLNLKPKLKKAAFDLLIPANTKVLTHKPRESTDKQSESKKPPLKPRR